PAYEISRVWCVSQYDLLTRDYVFFFYLLLPAISTPCGHFWRMLHFPDGLNRHGRTALRLATLNESQPWPGRRFPGSQSVCACYDHLSTNDCMALLLELAAYRRSIGPIVEPKYPNLS
ncbi:unnamed protein product, partial [Laminaria digitata]